MTGSFLKFVKLPIGPLTHVPWFQATNETIGAHTTTIVYLRIVIIQILSTFLLMGAQGLGFVPEGALPFAGLALPIKHGK